MNQGLSSLKFDQYGIVEVENFLSKDFCSRQVQEIQNQKLRTAQVQNSIDKNINLDIRKSYLSWIDDWKGENQYLKIVLTDLMLELSNFFRLSLKRFESQYSFYDNGGFYKKHLDQNHLQKHRQVSCLIYLNDLEKGGELVLYEPENREKEYRIIKPQVGKLVLFPSSNIVHEVKLNHSPRYAINTWFRDDEVLW